MSGHKLGLLSVALITLIGWAASGNALGVQQGRYTNPGGFSIEPPAGWKRDDARVGAAKPGTARFFGPSANSYTTNLAATGAKTGTMTLDLLVNNLKAEAAQSKGNLVISGDKRLTVDSAPTAIIRSRRKLPELGITLEQRQLVSLKDGTGAVLTMSFLPNTATKNDPIWDRVAASFRWK